MTPSLYIRQLLKDFYLDDTCDKKSRTFYISFSLLTKHSSFPTQGIGQLATILLKTAHLENAYTLHNIIFFSFLTKRSFFPTHGIGQLATNFLKNSQWKNE